MRNHKKIFFFVFFKNIFFILKLNFSNFVIWFSELGEVSKKLLRKGLNLKLGKVFRFLFLWKWKISRTEIKKISREILIPNPLFFALHFQFFFWFFICFFLWWAKRCVLRTCAKWENRLNFDRVTNSCLFAYKLFACFSMTH